MPVITLTVDERLITASEGETILQAAAAAGIDIPTAGVLDLLRAEMEFHKDSLGTDTKGDLALIGLIRKNFGKISLDFIAGSDPKFLGSQKLRHVGFGSRVTAVF